MSEIVGPAGSMSEGVFSRANVWEDEGWFDEELLEDCAQAGAGTRPAKRQQTAIKKPKILKRYDVIGKPCCKSS